MPAGCTLQGCFTNTSDTVNVNSKLNLLAQQTILFCYGLSLEPNQNLCRHRFFPPCWSLPHLQLHYPPTMDCRQDLALACLLVHTYPPLFPSPLLLSALVLALFKSLRTCGFLSSLKVSNSAVSHLPFHLSFKESKPNYLPTHPKTLQQP